jgi:hypothetical protein
MAERLFVALMAEQLTGRLTGKLNALVARILDVLVSIVYQKT